MGVFVCNLKGKLKIKDKEIILLSENDKVYISEKEPLSGEILHNKIYVKLTPKTAKNFFKNYFKTLDVDEDGAIYLSLNRLKEELEKLLNRHNIMTDEGLRTYAKLIVGNDLAKLRKIYRKYPDVIYLGEPKSLVEIEYMSPMVAIKKNRIKIKENIPCIVLIDNYIYLECVGGARKLKVNKNINKIKRFIKKKDFYIDIDDEGYLILNEKKFKKLVETLKEIKHTKTYYEIFKSYDIKPSGKLSEDVYKLIMEIINHEIYILYLYFDDFAKEIEAQENNKILIYT
jgi:Ca2+-binding EF-hand superfamily protein